MRREPARPEPDTRGREVPPPGPPQQRLCEKSRSRSREKEDQDSQTEEARSLSSRVEVVRVRKPGDPDAQTEILETDEEWDWDEEPRRRPLRGRCPAFKSVPPRRKSPDSSDSEEEEKTETQEQREARWLRTMRAGEELRESEREEVREWLDKKIETSKMARRPEVVELSSDSESEPETRQERVARWERIITESRPLPTGDELEEFGEWLDEDIRRHNVRARMARARERKSDYRIIRRWVADDLDWEQDPRLAEVDEDMALQVQDALGHVWDAVIQRSKWDK